MEHECIIGMYNNYEDTDIVAYADMEKLNTLIYLPYEFCVYFDKRKNTELTRFDYCPYCGKKIDWNELKRRCKDDR